MADGQERTVRKEGRKSPLRSWVSEVPGVGGVGILTEVEACVINARQGEAQDGSSVRIKGAGVFGFQRVPAKDLMPLTALNLS